MTDCDTNAAADDPAPADAPGVYVELGALPPSTPITEAGLAHIMKRHPSAIKRAVQRGELPRPERLCGEPIWTVGVIIKHLEGRLSAKAAAHDESNPDRARFHKRVARLMA